MIFVGSIQSHKCCKQVLGGPERYFLAIELEHQCVFYLFLTSLRIMGSQNYCNGLDIPEPSQKRESNPSILEGPIADS